MPDADGDVGGSKEQCEQAGPMCAWDTSEGPMNSFCAKGKGKGKGNKGKGKGSKKNDDINGFLNGLFGNDGQEKSEQAPQILPSHPLANIQDSRRVSDDVQIGRSMMINPMVVVECTEDGWKMEDIKKMDNLIKAGGLSMCGVDPETGGNKFMGGEPTAEKSSAFVVGVVATVLSMFW